MTGRYKAYPEYKESNHIWLGSVPAHWDILRAKRIFTAVRVPVKESDEQLAASQKYGVVPQSLMMKLNNAKVMLALKGTDSFRHVDKDNFVISLRSFEGGIEHSAYEGCVSPAYTVLKASLKQCPVFFKYLLKCEPFIAALQSTTDSLRDGKSISYEQFGSIYLPYCNFEEQQKIINFLDHETAKIDTLITKQEKLIELLKEKRQAVISHAVTKGLNPDAPMKDSGVEWLGEVPEHWVVGSLSHSLSAIGDVDHYMPTSIEKGVPYVMTGDLTELASGIVFEDCKQVNHSDYLKLSKRIKTSQGDVIMARYATIGTASYVDIDKDFLVSYSCVTIKPSTNRAIGLYLFYYFKSQAFLQGLQSHINTNTQGNVGVSDLKKVKITLPNLDEQKLIIEHLQSLIDKFDDLSEKSLATIELMKERKTALISAAVTGKIDVRDWQGEA
ncbi:restriction endonuclease subunit S [Vibrio kanaloae]|uniref:restriction endonuclease subunit S n=1 Tax=Vibrio kanaloae TaxID=170673 RepID=UPI000C856AEC|nr:restriction endonuclease subunit S [Vibrio kanaloae]PMM03772.1 restriction endonuclease subunit S [Vibrio kanaloae]